MNTIRIFSPVGLLSIGVAIFLLLAIGFVAWLTLSDVNIDFGGLTLSQVGQSELSARQFSVETADGLAIYHQSERSFAPSRANAEGLAKYHRSERGLYPFTQSNSVGLEIYRQSERGSVVPNSKVKGMEIYLQSERNMPLADSGSKDIGMEIYYASERER